VEQIHSWERDGHCGSHEIPRLVKNPMIHYRPYKNSQLDPIDPTELDESSLVIGYGLDDQGSVPCTCR
jgi:hypothetical protein